MTRCEESIKWACKYLQPSQVMSNVNVIDIVDTAYSKVYKLQIETQTYYLKKTPRALYSEPHALLFLEAQKINGVPRAIAKNDKLNCYLMSSIGDTTLRENLNGKLSKHLLEKGLILINQIMMSLSACSHLIKEAHAPNWSPEMLPKLYDELVKQEELLKRDGLSNKAQEDLHKLKSIMTNYCERLNEIGIPNTIAHSDFHDNNMVLNLQSQKVGIIDWCEVSITHPFFPICTFLWNLTYFYKIGTDDELYLQLRDYALEAWIKEYGEEKCNEAFNIASMLHGFYAALTYYRLYNATKNESVNVLQTHPGSIAGCLNGFLAANRRF